MNYLEIIIGLLYSVIIVGIASILKNKMTSPQTQKYFYYGLLLKLIGGLSVGLIYYFYYGGGDTITYFQFGANYIFEAFLDSPSVAMDMIFGDNVYTTENLQYVQKIWVFRDDASYMCVRFTGFFNLFSFNTYAGTVILMSFFSFLTVWRLYQLLTDLYPDLHKEFAISFLFLPSVFFWGSGILKDTLTFAFLCLFIHSTFKIYYYKKNILINILILLISGYFIAQIKIYILIALIPALSFLFLFGPIKKLKNPVFKFLLTPILLVIAITIGFFAMQQIGESSSRYNLDKMSETAEETARWIHYVSEKEGGSSYSLGDYDFSPFGIVKKTIPAIWVTIFRPHPWEVRNPVMLLAGLEALFFLWLFWRAYFYKFKLNSKARSSSVIITFCLIFSLVLSWAVGLTSYNFGSLVRYKIPMMPFFAISMYMMRRNKELLLKQKQ